MARMPIVLAYFECSSMSSASHSKPDATSQLYPFQPDLPLTHDIPRERVMNRNPASPPTYDKRCNTLTISNVDRIDTVTTTYARVGLRGAEAE